jgi:hypothetical protein
VSGTIAISALLLATFAAVVVFAVRAAGRERWHVAGILGGVLLILFVPFWSVVTHAFLAALGIWAAGAALLGWSLVVWDKKKNLTRHSTPIPCHADILSALANDPPAGEADRENPRWATG